jgi:hypothetical protein
MKLKIKSFRGEQFSCSNFFPHPQHLPAQAVAEQRKKILPGEEFEVSDDDPVADFYLQKVEEGFLELCATPSRGRGRKASDTIDA